MTQTANGIRLTGVPAFKTKLTDTQMWQVGQLLAHTNEIPDSVKKLLVPDVTPPMWYPGLRRLRRRIRQSSEAQNLTTYPEAGLWGHGWTLVPDASRLLIYSILLFSSVLVSAQALTGRVTNDTTSKPAGGDRVVLISLDQGMEEVAHTRTNANGHFSFHLPDAGAHRGSEEMPRVR